VKTSFAGQTFDDPKQLLEAITEFLNEIEPPEVIVVFSHWVERVRWVLENIGDYYHE
jgi:aromatic ring-opening dioxygenase catalytic subunit (LigB family)